MRIAQIAPPIESVPPTCYGGTERVVSYLTEELVKQGHQLTLFASGNSLTSAELVPCTKTALRLTPTVRDPIPYYMLMLDKVRERADEFDILHFHIDQFHFPIFRPMAQRTLTTLHGRQDLPDLQALYRGFTDMPLVSISNAQRRPCAAANFAATVYHGIPKELHTANVDRRGSYLAFLGRICPEKRVDHAIAIARAAGVPLKIAAKVDKVDEEYFREAIIPLLNGPGVEFIGEINEHAKTKFLGDAAWSALSDRLAGAFRTGADRSDGLWNAGARIRRGSVPEIVDQGVTGYIVDTPEEAIAVLPDVLSLDRHAVRQRFEERFSAERMARDYLKVYHSLLATPTRREVEAREFDTPRYPGRNQRQRQGLLC